MGQSNFQTFDIKEYHKIKFEAATMDKRTYKGCYLEVKGQFTSKQKNNSQTMRKVIHELKLSIEKSLDNDFFRDKFITHEDYSYSFKDTGSTFTKLEFTLYPKRQTNKVELTKQLNLICEKIYKEIFDDNQYMEFNKDVTRIRHG